MASVIEEWYQLCVRFVQTNGWYLVAAAVVTSYLYPVASARLKVAFDAMSGEKQRQEILNQKRKMLWKER